MVCHARDLSARDKGAGYAQRTGHRVLCAYALCDEGAQGEAQEDAGTASKVENTVWAQEWARVSPTGGTLAKYTDAEDSSVERVIYWAPTFEEKKLRIEETLNYSLDRTIKGDIVYINSLCGYYIDPEIEISCVPNSNTDWGGIRCLTSSGMETSFVGNYWKVKKLTGCDPQSGMAGDIGTYAMDINNYFYKLLTDKQAAGGLGSGMGIVLMDRVSNSAETDPAGYYIPQIIWTNNEFAVSATSNVSITYSDTPFDASSDTPAAPARR